MNLKHAVKVGYDCDVMLNWSAPERDVSPSFGLARLAVPCDMASRVLSTAYHKIVFVHSRWREVWLRDWGPCSANDIELFDKCYEDRLRFSGARLVFRTLLFGTSHIGFSLREGVRLRN